MKTFSPPKGVGPTYTSATAVRVRVMLDMKSNPRDPKAAPTPALAARVGFQLDDGAGHKAQHEIFLTQLEQVRAIVNKIANGDAAGALAYGESLL
jgi:hypothetical protein